VTRDSDGSATIWAVSVLLVIWAAAAVSSLEVAAVQVRHHAAAAADAAALAAAGEGGRDPAAACVAAREAAARVGSRLESCTMTGPYALVTVAVSPPAPFTWAGQVQARARAGPADSTSNAIKTDNSGGVVT
jgi:secretion/DNA translocation related TadE-like protein